MYSISSEILTELKNLSSVLRYSIVFNKPQTTQKNLVKDIQELLDKCAENSFIVEKMLYNLIDSFVGIYRHFFSYQYKNSLTKKELLRNLEIFAYHLNKI